MSGSVHAEVEIPCPEAEEEVDVGEPTVVEDQQSDPQSVPQSVSQPVATVRVGGSSSSGTRAGSGSPHLMKNGIRIPCNTENFVPIVVPGLSSSSSGSSSASRTPM